MCLKASYREADVLFTEGRSDKQPALLFCCIYSVPTSLDV